MKSFSFTKLIHSFYFYLFSLRFYIVGERRSQLLSVSDDHFRRFELCLKMGTFPTTPTRSTVTTTSFTTITPPPVTKRWAFSDIEITISPDPRPAFNDDSFVAIMKSRLGITSYLSIQSSIMNSLLLSFLLYNKEFRSWLFFPLMLQAAIDIIGPGISNLLFEWKLYLQVLSMTEHYNEFMEENQRFVVRRVEDLNALSDVTGCFLMYVRCLLNEYTTGRDSRKSQTNIILFYV